MNSLTGEPLPAVNVFLKPQSLDVSKETSSAVADSDGLFTLPAVPTGYYLFKAELSGFAAVREILALGQDPSTGILSGSNSHWIGDIYLQRGFTLTLIVVDNETRRPVPGSSLYTFEGSAGRSLRPVQYLGSTDQSGILHSGDRVAALGPDAVLLALSDKGMAWIPLGFLPRDTETHNLEVDLKSGANVTVLVSNIDDAPLGDAVVTLTPETYPFGPLGVNQSTAYLGDEGRLRSRFRARSDAAGRAEFRGLFSPDQACTYTITASKVGYDSGIVTERRIDRLVSIIPLRLLKTAVIDSLDGTVSTVDGGTLIDARVHYGTHIALVDSTSGRYQLEHLQVPAGSLVPEASARGYCARKRRLPTGVAGAVAMDFVLYPARTITGLITDDASLALPGTKLSLRAADQATAQIVEPTSTVANQDGSFAFSSIPDGTYSLRAYPHSEQDVFEHLGDLKVKAGDLGIVITCSRVLNKNCSLQAAAMDAVTHEPVRIVAASLIPLNESTVQAQPPNQSEFVFSAGQVSIRAIRCGSWRLFAIDSDRRIGYIDVVLDSPQVSASLLQVQIGEPPVIAGTVQLQDSSSTTAFRFTSVRIDARRATPTSRPPGTIWSQAIKDRDSVYAEADGTFMMLGLLPGEYTLTATSAGFFGQANCSVAPSEVLPVSISITARRPAARLVISGSTSVFDGNHSLWVTEADQPPLEVPLVSDYLGMQQMTLTVASGTVHLQCGRRPAPGANSPPVVPSELLYDHTVELDPKSTMTIVLPDPP